jgi:hypothetical protein
MMGAAGWGSQRRPHLRREAHVPAVQQRHGALLQQAQQVADAPPLVRAHAAAPVQAARQVVACCEMWQTQKFQGDIDIPEHCKRNPALHDGAQAAGAMLQYLCEAWCNAQAEAYRRCHRSIVTKYAKDTPVPSGSTAMGGGIHGFASSCRSRASCGAANDVVSNASQPS